MKRSLFFIFSFLVVASAYSVTPQAAAEVKKDVAVECKCDDKCTATCACPKCPKKEATKAAATKVAAQKADETKAKA